MKNKKYFFYISLQIFLIFFLAGNLLAAKRFHPLEINQIVFSEESIKTNKMQLVEVSIKNYSKKNIPLRCKLRIKLPNGKTLVRGNKRVVAISETETPVLFNYWVNKKNSGKYRVEALLATPTGRRIAIPATKNKFGYFIASLDGKGLIKTPEEELKKVPRIAFEPVDLAWKTNKIQNTSVLRGESSNFSVSFTNDGGNVAEDISYSLYWFFAPRPNRKTLIHKGHVNFLAPGETKYLEYPLTIPKNEQKGNYKVLAVLDELGKVIEDKKENNILVSENSMTFTDLALSFPTDNYIFTQGGLFRFKWRSKKYNQFKVQISSNVNFDDCEQNAEEPQCFQLPLGNVWSSETSATPLEGEVKMMFDIMKKAEQDHLYWRIQGYNSAGDQGMSNARKFYINLAAE